MRKLKNKKGISLIVLVIVIIIMIILATVIISIALDGNIIEQAIRARAETEQAQAKEQAELEEARLRMKALEENQVTDKTPGTMAGEGTSETPYLIESIEDFVVFKKSLEEDLNQVPQQLLSYSTENKKYEVSLLLEGGNETLDYEGQHVSLNQTLNFTNDKSYKNPEDTQFGDLNGDGIIEGIKKELTTNGGWKTGEEVIFKRNI